jgi:hypothetical protein
MISRRDALKKMAAGGAAAATSVFWVDALAAAAEQQAPHHHAAVAAATGPWKPKVFTAAQNATVVALAETIIPKTDTPGATDANVNRFIDSVLASASTEDRQKFIDGLGWLDAHVTESHGATFLKAPAETQLAVLTDLSKAPSDTPGADFFRAIKSLTVTGYYTSEIAMREEIGDDGSMFFTEFKGCTHEEHQ